MAASNSDRGRMIAGINVTPLVDVVLVLLVVLMVTATQVARQSLPLDLPDASTGKNLSGPLTVDIDTEGRAYVEGQAVTLSKLAEMARLKVSADGSARAVVAADGGVAHRHVVQVIDTLRSEGVIHYAVVVDSVNANRGAH